MSQYAKAAAAGGIVVHVTQQYRSLSRPERKRERERERKIYDDEKVGCDDYDDDEKGAL
jgi:hypothetical protein